MMKKELGIFVLLLALGAYVAFMNPRFLLAANLENTAALVGMYGIFSIGLGLVIITGGIDLSVGSLFALQGVALGLLLGEGEWPWFFAAAAMFVGTMLLGLMHGVLITRLKIQPFIVTLCGLLIYRGAARWIADDEVVGFGMEPHGMLRWLQSGKLPAVPIPSILFAIVAIAAVFWAWRFIEYRKGEHVATRPSSPPAGATLEYQSVSVREPSQQRPVTLILWMSAIGILALIAAALTWLRYSDGILPAGRGGSTIGQITKNLATGSFAAPMPFVLLIIVAIAAGILLHGSVYGRYLYAVGRNEEATRYSGVNTKRVVTAAYVISAALTALSGMLFAFYANAITPASHGNFYELFGIAAAVLGGCSLRGGEGSVLGIVLGAALIQVLQNLVNLLQLPTSLNFAVLGGVILIGVLADQLLSEHSGRFTRLLPRLRRRPATAPAATVDTSEAAQSRNADHS